MWLPGKLLLALGVTLVNWVTVVTFTQKDDYDVYHPLFLYVGWLIIVVVVLE